MRKNVYRLLSEYLATQADKVTPEAYHVVAQQQKRLNPVLTLGRVAIVGFGFFFLYVLITFLLWGRLVGDIRAVAQAMGVA